MNTPSRELVIWDPVVRMFHWTLAGAFFLNMFVTEDGSFSHRWIGYVALCLLGVRAVWGFVGPRRARFSDFVPTRSRLRTHVQHLKHRTRDPTEGHNPLGGSMAIALMALILGLGISGYMMENVDAFFGEEWLEELHEALANLMLAAVAVHVSAVLFMQHWTGQALIRPMLTGRRRLPPS